MNGYVRNILLSQKEDYINHKLKELHTDGTTSTLTKLDLVL